MALVLSVKEDGVFYVGDTPVRVVNIQDSLRFDVRVETPYMNHVYKISETKAVEILPDVKVSAGKNGSEHAVKIVIEAPKNIRILRERLYRDEGRRVN